MKNRGCLRGEGRRKRRWGWDGGERKLSGVGGGGAWCGAEASYIALVRAMVTYPVRILVISCCDIFVVWTSGRPGWADISEGRTTTPLELAWSVECCDVQLFVTHTEKYTRTRWVGCRLGVEKNADSNQLEKKMSNGILQLFGIFFWRYVRMRMVGPIYFVDAVSKRGDQRCI